MYFCNAVPSSSLILINSILTLNPRAVFDKETSRREELQGSFLRPHTQGCPGRAIATLPLQLQFLILFIMGQRQYTQGYRLGIEPARCLIRSLIS